MFHMMNEARIGVGFQATAHGYAGYLRPSSTQAAHSGSAGRRQGPAAPAGGDGRPRRRQANVAGAEVLRRGRVGARALLLRGCSTRNAPARRDRDARTCCSKCSRRSPRAGRRSGASRPTASPSRYTAGTAIPRSSTSNSATATTGSTRSMRGPTASRPRPAGPQGRHAGRRGPDPAGARRSIRPSTRRWSPRAPRADAERVAPSGATVG